MIAVSSRLGHANPVITMMIYAHVDKQLDRGLLTPDELGLPPGDHDTPRRRQEEARACLQCQSSHSSTIAEMVTIAR